MGNEIWPSAVDYVEAAQCLARVANDHVVRDCQIERTPLGLPVAASGQNAIVFRVNRGVERIALRCFTTAAGDSAAHYSALDRFLAEHPLPAFAHASWRTDAMVVNGRPRPVLLMEWIDGVPLHRAIEERLRDAAALRELAADWSTLAHTVAASGMAHGDYQHGNVLVTDDGELRLVDFDGAWLPNRPRAAYREFGHRNYQHPERAATAQHGPEVDGFAALLIWLSIRAVAASPALWAKYHDGDNLLATERDLRDLAAPLWAALASSPDPEVRAGALRLRAAALRPAADAGSVAELVSGEVPGRTADRLPTPQVPHAPAGPVAAPRRERGRMLTAAACVGLVLAVAIGVAGASTGGAGTTAIPDIARTDDATGTPTTAPPSTVPPTTAPPRTVPPTTAPTTTVPPTVPAPPAAPQGNDVPVAPPTTVPAAPPVDEAPPTTAPPTTAPPTTAPPTTAPPTTVAPASFVMGNLLGLDGIAVDEALRARGVTVRWFAFRSSRPANTVVDQRLVMPGTILSSGMTIDLGYSDNAYCAAQPVATTCMLSTQLP